MKTLRLNELKGVAKIIAEAKIKVHGEYLCKINGEKVRVIAD